MQQEPPLIIYSNKTMKPVSKEDRPVLFLDSGIGGIPYCRHFCERNTREKIVYLADRLHFPYGNRKREELAEILTSLVEQIIEMYNPKIAVLACNTATLAALSGLRNKFPKLPFVGTVPAVKPAVLASKTGRIGVLGTELTINDPYIRELAAQFGSCEITGIAAPELVELAENRLESLSAEERKTIANNYLDRFREAGADVIVLGCTHFLFFLEDFRQAAVPDITVFESVDGISHRIGSLLDEFNSKEQPEEQNNEKQIRTPCNQYSFLLTGSSAPEPSWINWADRLGFSLLLLEKR